MEFIRWILNNFGPFFGAVFLLYLFLIIRRFTMLYDALRGIRPQEPALPLSSRQARVLDFLSPFFERLAGAARVSGAAAEAVVDAIWSEVDRRIAVHFSALNGYANTLILLGFAGTIFGSIGAFNEMFQGLARGETAAVVFVASWNNGLATALYTSLGAAAIGGVLLTLLGSRPLSLRAKMLETLVGLHISEILERESRCTEEDATPFKSGGPKTLERTSSPISLS
jgi:hypothetical protein